MGRILIFFIAFFSVVSQCFSLDLSLHISRFYADHQPYVEVNFHAMGATLTPQISPDSTVHSGVKILVLFKQAGDIKRFDTFVFESPKSRDIVDFSAVRRYGIAPGIYDIIITGEDIFKSTNTTSDSIRLEIKPLSLNTPTISDFQIYASSIDSDYETLAKHGKLYELLPYNYAGTGQKKVGVYVECYSPYIGKDSLSHYQVNFSKIESNGKSKTVGRYKIKRKATDWDVITAEYDIAFFASGKYEVKIVHFDDQKKPLDSTMQLLVIANPDRDAVIFATTQSDDVANSFVGKLNAADLNYSLRAIAMNVPSIQTSILNEIIKNDDMDAKANFLYRYCYEKSPTYPEEWYSKYMEVARAVDKNFKSGLGYGFETDRGLMFMKYGKPDDMLNVQDDPSCAPYEIWVYYRIPKLNQSNVKFLFYNPFLDGSDYRLLHSNARGELSNKDWKKILYKSMTSEQPKNLSPDDWDVQKGFNRQAAEWLEDM